LAQYATKDILIVCFRKFLQSRIVRDGYNFFELEIEIVRRMSNKFGTYDSQNIINGIHDIINSKTMNETLHSSLVNIVSDRYKQLSQIDMAILSPIILTRKNILYPLEMECYMNIIDKMYKNTDNTSINWCPLMGYATLEACIGKNKIVITCNILQAIALIYINDNPQLSYSKFSTDTLINDKLTRKILGSLLEANLIISTDDDAFIVNHVNYTGDIKINIQGIFIDMFNQNSATIDGFNE
jgi:hypothetical protein